MYIKIVGDTSKYQGKLERVGSHLIKVSGLIQHNTGFRLYLDNDTMVGDYSAFIHPYLDPNLGEGVYMYSDNGITYEENQNTPTKEQTERQKIESVINSTVGVEINDLTQQMISMNESLLPMYEILIQLQEAILGANKAPTENEEQPKEEEQPKKSEETEEAP